jgi:hypothetical protein
MNKHTFLCLMALVGCAPGSESTGAVTVTVLATDSTEPALGVPVVFHDSSGAALATVETGADGKATGEIPEGGQITVARAEDLVTIAGAEIGASYVVGGEVAPARVPLGNAQITTPGALAGAPAGATYSVSVGCSAQSFTPASGNVSVPVFPSCQGSGGTVHVLARVLDGNGGLAGFSAVTALAASSGWTATLPAWVTSDALTLSVTSAPAGTLALGGELDFVLGGRVFQGSRLAATGTTASFDFPFDAAAVDGVSLTAIASFGAGESFSSQTQIGELTGAQSLALADVLLPRITNVSVSSGARAEMTFSSAGSLAGVDGGVATFNWEDEGIWRVVVPPGASSPIKLPALPDELAELRPSAAADLPTLSFWESSGVSSYAGFVETVLARRMTAPPASGTLTVRQTHFDE